MTPKILHFVGNNYSMPDELTAHVELDLSVVEIPKGIFSGLRKLVEVTLREDDKACCDTNHGKRQEINTETSMMNQSQLTVIGREAFWDCPHLRLVSFPSGLERIDSWAFGNCPKLQPPPLPDSLETIGPFAFCGCNFRHLRIPQLITCLSNRMLECCTKLYSIEVPENLIMHTSNTSFYGCERLRNIVFPNLKEDDSSQTTRLWCHGCEDLLQVFADPNELGTALAHRFDGLPIHRLCYYHSYHGEGDAGHNTVIALKEEWMSFDSSSHPSSPFASSMGTETKSAPPKCGQDFLGMTPLHILALSAAPRPELMELLIELDPIQLVTPDFWGYLPIYYACECWNTDSGSNDRIRLLLQRHMAIFPDFNLDWTKLVTATGHMALAKLLLSEASSLLNNVPYRLLASIPTSG